MPGKLNFLREYTVERVVDAATGQHKDRASRRKWSVKKAPAAKDRLGPKVVPVKDRLGPKISRAKERLGPKDTWRGEVVVGLPATRPGNPGIVIRPVDSKKKPPAGKGKEKEVYRPKPKSRPKSPKEKGESSKAPKEKAD